MRSGSPRGFGGDGDDGIVDPCVRQSGRGRRVVRQGGGFVFLVFWYFGVWLHLGCEFGVVMSEGRRGGMSEEEGRWGSAFLW